MTIHICRDFLSEGASTLQVYYAAIYYIPIYMRSILGFTIIGQTGLDIEGTYLIDEGTLASINLGTNLESVVELPIGQYSVTSSDIGRILVLKSSSYPSYNSGLFRIVSVDSVNNRCYIDYRSSSSPPAETSTVQWAIYDNELNVSFSVSDNNAGGGVYETQGAATASRIILESPTNLWQVRLCLEGATDQGNFQVRMSITTGLAGNSSGDWTVSTTNCHYAQFYNRTSSDYVNLVPGIGQVNTSARGGWRFYIWGSEDPDNVLFIVRNAGGNSSTMDTWCSFGMTEFETEPVSTNILHRTYSIGTSRPVDSLTWASSFSQSSSDGLRGGSAFGLLNVPVSAIASTYCRLVSQSTYTNSIRYSAFSQDSTMTKQTDLFLVDIIAGTWDAMNSSGQVRVAITEARRIGTLPFARMGRANFGDWSLAINTNNSWFHARDGIYLPWDGPLILP